MLMPLLADAGLLPEVCADLLGIDSKMFTEWANGTKEIPSYILPELSSMLGVDQNLLAEGKVEHAPAIWFKFRDTEHPKDKDRELVALLRRLGFYAKQLNEVTGFVATKWRLQFRLVAEELAKSRHEAPVVQGELAARTFRENVSLGFSHPGSTSIHGSGDIIRGILRNLGILVIEMPVPESNMDGCSFYVGETGSDLGTPCLFINTYRQSWFRRNYVLAHELAHAIFDIEGESALVDYREDAQDVKLTTTSVMEARADAFARNCYASKKVLEVISAKLGLDWKNLTTLNLAQLVAHAQVDLKVILKSAVESQFLSQEAASQHLRARIHKPLRAISERALTPDEYLAKTTASVWTAEERETNIPSRKLRLPVPYIKTVLEATMSNLISEGKAAELLMIDEDKFTDRFGAMLTNKAA